MNKEERKPLLQRLKLYITEKAKGPHGEIVLALTSFAESSFFIVPPDVVIVAMVLSGVNRWKYLATLTTIMSVLGGLFGYLIGYAFYETLGERLVAIYDLYEEVEKIGTLFNEHAFLSIFVAAFTPIPYKAFTISAGLFRIDLLIFVVASILGRGLRFTGVAFITQKFGPFFLRLAEKYITFITVIFLVILFFILLFSIV